MNCASCQNCFTCQIVGSGCTNCLECQKCFSNQQGRGGFPEDAIVPPKERKIFELTLWNTGRCNLDCDYCFAYKIYGKKKDADMDDETIQYIPSFVKKYMPDEGSIWFFGAEPTVSMDTISKIYDLVKKEKPQFKFGMTTNGVALANPEVAKWFGARRFGILISMDGFGETHDIHRKYPDGRGSFEDVMKGVLNARVYITQNPQIRWTYTPETVDRLYETYCNFVGLGLLNLACEPIYECEWTEDKLKILEEEMRKIGLLIRDMHFRGYNYVFKPLSDVSLVASEKKQDWRMRCGLVPNMGSVGVDVDGKIYACHRFVSGRDENVAIGSLKDGIDWSRVETLQKEWIAERPYCNTNRYRCAECPLLSICIGGCVAVNRDVTGDWHKCPQSFCDVQLAIFRGLIETAVILKNHGGVGFMQPHKV